MPRQDGRRADALRPVRITRRYLRHAEGSVLIEMGHTRVLCAATVEPSVPPHRKGSGKGWITAEYGMLPRSTAVRVPREAMRGVKGRTHEIMRLIGRSLRVVVDLEALGERTIVLDCDVIEADGGTRTAAVTGSCVALHDALSTLKLPRHPMRELAAAVSVGLWGGEAVLDLDYSEDSSADVDMNVVMAESGRFIEVQGTAEAEPFAAESLFELLRLARHGLEQLFEVQRQVLSEPL